MQTPVVGKCEQYLNGAWVDLSARVPWLATPVSISRGLDDSGAPTAGSMTLTMANDDGALTPGATVELRRNHVVIPRATASWGISAGTGGATTNSVQADARFAGGVARQAIFDTAPTVANTAYISSAGSGSVMAVGETWVIAMRVAAVGYAGIYNLRVGGTNAPVCTYGVQQAIDHGDGTYTIWNTATCTSLGAGTGAFVVFATIGSALTNGAQIRMGDAFAEKGATSFNGYFDGGYSPDGAMAPAWTGTANASASILTGVGAYLVRWRPIRVSVWVDGAWRQRFYGFVDSEPLSWPTGDAGYCIVTVTAVDLAARAAVRTLRSIAVEATAAKSPIAYWPLTDAQTISAADQSGLGRPGLGVQQQGTGGEASWGGGTALPTDLSGGLLLTPASDNGVYLASAEGIDLPTSWSLSIWVGPAAKDGYVCQVGNDGYSIGIWYDTSTKELSAVETISDEDSTVDYVLSTTTATWTTGIETMTVTPTTVKLGSSGTTGTRHNSDQMLASRVSVGGALTDPPSRQQMYSGEVKHLALWSGSVPANVASDILTGPSGLTTVQGIVTTALGWAGLSGSVTTRGTNQATVTPAIEGASVSALMGDLARGSLGRIAADRSGGITVTAWDYSPSPVTAPAGEIDPGVQWVADPEADVTQVTMSWPDGSSYIVTDSADRPTDLPGVLTQAAGRSVAEWVVKAPAGAPRFPDAGYDLMTLPDATVAALCGLDVGDRITIPGLPTQLPSSSQTAIVDSFAETIGVDQWMLQMATSPDPRDALFIVGDATRGVVGAGFLAAPLGAGRSGVGSWRAGEPIDAARLNARQYTGSMVQAGSVQITPTAGVNTSLAVTFPTAFPSAPKVVLTHRSGAPWTEVKGICVSAISTTGFTLWVRSTTATDFGVYWMAAV